MRHLIPFLIAAFVGVGLFFTYPAGAAAQAPPGEPVPSPDGRWQAMVNPALGSLRLSDGEQSRLILPAGSSVSSVSWAPNSRRLLVARVFWQPLSPPGQGVRSFGPAEIWQVELPTQSTRPFTTTRLFRPDPADLISPLTEPPQQIRFGTWSPDGRFVTFWMGMLSASILADGLPMLALDTQTGSVLPLGVSTDGVSQNPPPFEDNIALLTPGYHSWAPDSRHLAVTAGSYRSAQVNKWLNLADVISGTVTTVISQSQQIPGLVAWSPRGETVAYAAVEANQTAPELADLMTFDNPAIAARRIYLLDPATGESRRLNQIDAYQDAPVWSVDGCRLYYVQRSGQTLNLMAADLATGRTLPVPGASQPLDLPDSLGQAVGYYGQFGRLDLLDQIPPPSGEVTCQ